MKTQKTKLGRLKLLMRVSITTSVLCTTTYAQDIRSQNLIGFSTGIRNQYGGPNQALAMIRQGVSRMTRQNRNSLTRALPTTVGIIWFPGAPDGDLSTALSRWRNRQVGVGRTGGGTPQGQIESARRVDVSSLMTRGSGPRGISGGFTSAYNCTRHPFINRHTQGHEMGHNYNASHAAGHGLRAGGRMRYTSMASGGRDVNSIIDFYSNPNTRFQGVRTGTNSRFNARTVHNNRFRIRDRKR